jgi:hypothetical protein
VVVKRRLAAGSYGKAFLASKAAIFGVDFTGPYILCVNTSNWQAFERLSYDDLSPFSFFDTWKVPSI